MFNTLLVNPLANGLVAFYKIFGGNMGIAIIAFSIFLKILLHPLTRVSLENMKKMQSFKPELDKLKKKHEGDQKKFMAAQADFYKSKGFNPAAGCLPQIAQLVVLYAFFAVFHQVLVADTNVAQKLNSILYPPLRFAQTETINTKFLYLDIVKPDVVNIPGVPFPLPGLFVIAAALSQFLSLKIVAPIITKEEKLAKKTKGKEDDTMVAFNKMSAYYFPVLTLIFGMQFASGLTLYWLVFSLVQTYQQYRISGLGGLTPLVQKLRLLPKTA